jgi:uncharacterized protein YcgL (UPF0745 family)
MENEEINKLKNLNLTQDEINKIIKLYISNELSITELESLDIDPELVLLLDENLIIKFFEKGLPGNLTFSDEMLLHSYGRTLSGSTILKLCKLGYISHDKAILISNKHSLPITDPSLAVKPKEILDFYSAETLATMSSKNELTPEFVKNYNENVVSTLSDDDKDAHFRYLVASTENFLNTEDAKKINTVVVNDIDDEPVPEEEKPKTNFEKVLLYYYECGILPSKYAKDKVDFKSIQKHYANHKLNYSDLVDLYVNDIITSKQLLILLESSDITANQFYSNPVVSEEILRTITSEKKIAIFSESLKSKNLTPETLLYLYLHENVLSVNDLQNIFIENKITENISQYLTEENINLEKVEELYTHYLIDYNCLVSLKRENSITEADFDNIKDKINADEFYSDLSKVEDLYIHTTSDTISASIHHSINKNGIKKYDIKKEQEMLSSVFGSPTLREQLPLIHATDLNGNTTALDGYSCIPMKNFNIVTLKKFETDCDTYVMPYQQAAYFLHNSYEPDGSFSGNNGGFQAEIPLPFEDYVDPSAIAIVPSNTLDYRRNLFEAILELSDQEEEKEKLFKNGKPIPALSDFLKVEKKETTQDLSL